uniref:C-type lectin 2 n=1 Tax=Portunus trituberculatus TaxID=210409 RepID=A0A7S5QMV0_PORTR|nr:C-type lectin 2 [Portunus trituberculatus]
MRIYLLLAVALAVICSVAAQGRVLALPEIELCDNRPKQWKFRNHYYFFSWDQDGPDFKEVNPKTGQLEGSKVDWLKARNLCRQRCMDAVGMESEEENNMIFDFIKRRNITYIWTSGRLCDFKGCDEREDLKPISVKGWFFSNTNTKMAPTNASPPGWKYQPWSDKGHTGGPQPDNAEFDINQTSESCLGVLNNLYNDGIKWHDIACYHKKPFICEDSDELLRYIEGQKQQLQQQNRPGNQGQGNRGQGNRGQGNNDNANQRARAHFG